MRFLGTAMALVASFLLLFSALAFAAEPQVVTIEGRIMDWDLKKNMIVVNEKFFFWNPATLFYDENGSPIKAERLKMHDKVSIEGVKGSGKRQFIIQKLFLLPK